MAVIGYEGSNADVSLIVSAKSTKVTFSTKLNQLIRKPLRVCPKWFST
jgi:hypothetical protein